jgi:hypothetical protein
MATNGFTKIYNLNNVNYSDFENAILTNRWFFIILFVKFNLIFNVFIKPFDYFVHYILSAKIV